MEDIAVLKPTVLISVPRVLNKIYSAFSAKINSLDEPLKTGMNNII